MAGALSLMAWILLQCVAPPAVLPWTPAMGRAAETMAEALEATAAHCGTLDLETDPLLDPAGTCLIGPQIPPLFTTLGQLEAKRTTLNPDLAALLVHLLREAGVGSGDTVAVGASGSFPGLLVATLAAVEAMEAFPVAILSLGASSYGATRPEFHLLDLHVLLNREGIINNPPMAASLGGEGDVGEGFPQALRDSLAREVSSLGIPFLAEDSLPKNVARRMEIYCGSPEACPVTAFVNIGGAQANMGASPRILQVPPGLSQDLTAKVDLPPPPRRGVLFEMAAREVPFIHLLHIRGLALKHGLPWDPLFPPKPNSTRLLRGTPSAGLPFWLLSAAYLLGLALILISGLFPRHTVRRGPPSPSLQGKS